MLKKIPLALIVLLVLMQLYRPEKNISTEKEPASDFLLVNNAPENVAVIFKDACYDCHSNNTKYPWYSEVAPVSWWLANHIDEGKEHLNFSAWTDYNLKKKNHKLEEIIETVEKRQMPLKSYLPMHPEAKLSEAQITTLTDWVKTLQ